MNIRFGNTPTPINRELAVQNFNKIQELLRYKIDKLDGNPSSSIWQALANATQATGVQLLEGDFFGKSR